MSCYSPIRGLLSSGPDGARRLSFSCGDVGKGISLPCGRCIGCRLERTRQWAVRIMHEAKMHDENSFVTLTYNDENLPEGGSINVRDCQLWIKRLRERIAPVRIKFFMCGEYGEKLERPHYHAILFGYSFPDKVFFKGSGELSLYTSRLLSESWPHGFASVGSVSYDSAAYVAGYALKKINGPSAASFYKGRKPEFVLMSRGGRKAGGIGHGFIEKFGSDVFPRDEVICKGHIARPPRYYFEWLKKRDPESAEKVRIKREKEVDKLEEFVLSSGHAVNVAPSRNARRLVVRETVARAKLALKKKSLED